MRPMTVCLAVLALVTACAAQGGEWRGFRGSDALGTAAAGATPPLEWSDTKNRAWRTRLPGVGSSSPIVVGDRVYVTCYSDYGFDPDDPGHPLDLKRHLVCCDRNTGKILWKGTVSAKVAEDPYEGMVATHGYASATPVSDGENVYCFFGRTGVVAFDRDGKQLWHVGVGDGKVAAEEGARGRGGGRGRGGFGGGGMRWGSAASLAIAGEVVVVNASDSSNTIRGLDRKSGKELWKQSSPKVKGTAASPVTVKRGNEHLVVLALSGETWALDAKTGKPRWKVETGTRGAPNPTPVSDGERVYMFGGMRGRGLAILCADDVESERIVWSTRQNTDVPSPALHDGKLFLVDSRGMANVIDAKSGEALVNRQRLEGRTGGVYASPTIAGGRLYVVSRENGTFVYSADKELKLLAKNVFEDDPSEFNGSPAFVGGQMFLRSDTCLYCVQAPE